MPSSLLLPLCLPVECNQLHVLSAHRQVGFQSLYQRSLTSMMCNYSIPPSHPLNFVHHNERARMRHPVDANGAPPFQSLPGLHSLLNGAFAFVKVSLIWTITITLLPRCASTLLCIHLVAWCCLWPSLFPIHLISHLSCYPGMQTLIKTLLMTLGNSSFLFVCLHRGSEVSSEISGPSRSLSWVLIQPC
jgi:hypothetical protein